VKKICHLLTIGALVIATTACQTTNSDTAAALGYKQGDVVQSLVNLHPDSKGNRLYALNYQLPNVIPVCSEFTIDAVSTKSIKVTNNGIQYNYLWDKHTRKAGQSLADNFMLFFGDICDSNGMDKLSKIDKEGIEKGTALVGMSKKGVLFAMGQPPIHANPTTEANTWLYWRNRFGKRAVDFSSEGIVIKVR